MSRTMILAAALSTALVGTALAQGATGGGGSGGGGGGAVVESPQPGVTKTPPGTSSNTPGMASPSAKVATQAKHSTKPAAKKKGATTSFNEPPVNGVRPVAADGAVAK